MIDDNLKPANSEKQPALSSTPVNNLPGGGEYVSEAIHANVISENLKSPLRGALRLEVSASTPVVVAGKEFSIYVVIRNPFPVPVTVISTETHIPIELTDEIRKKQLRAHLWTEYIEKTHDKGWIQRLHQYIEYRRDLHHISSDPGPRVATAVGPAVLDQVTVQPPVIFTDVEAGGNISVTLGHSFDLHFENRSEQEINTILTQISEFRAGKLPDILQPGDSIVRHFNLKTTDWLLFAPIAHTFQIQVRYLLDNFAHVDTVPYELGIRAATISSIIGAIVGSLLGWFVHTNSSISWPGSAFTLLTSTIFALIVVVAFARKANVQQIVSVEDFWGGLFIGFLVGYSGESFVNSIIGIGS